jgi:hypothetical protein
MSFGGAAVAKDWFGEWFRVLEEAGEKLDLICGQLDEETKTVDWLRMAHRDFDGVGAIMEMIERGGGTIALPKRRLKPVPLFERARIFFRYSRSRPVLAPMVRLKTNEPNHPAGVAWVVLSREDTERVKARFAAEKVRETAYLVHCLHQSACELALVTNETPAWLVPVNLRGLVELDRPKGNHASFVTLSLPRDAPVIEAERQLLGQLRDKAHLGAWVAVNMGAVFGQKRFRKRTLEMFDNPFAWSGTFSNLGAWPGEQATLSDRLQRPAFGCPPVWRKVPLSVGCITWNGRMTFGFSVHAWLDGDPHIARKLAERFIEHALGEGSPNSRGTSVGFSSWNDIQQSERIST